MRKLPILFLFLFAGSLLAQKTVKISGTSLGMAQGQAVFSFEPLRIGSDPTIVESTVSDGSFESEFKLSGAEIVELAVGKDIFELFLLPGTNLSLSLGSESVPGQLEAKGDLAMENKFLHQFNAAHKEMYNKKSMEKKIMANGIDMFELDLYDSRRAQLAELEKAKAQSKMAPEFVSHMEQHIRSNYTHWMLAYPIVRANANAKKMVVTHLPRTIEQGFSDTPPNSDDALSSAAYRGAIYYFVTYFTSKANGFTKFKDYNKSVDEKMKTALARLEGETQAWYLSKLLYENCDKVAPGTMQEVQAKIKASGKGSAYLKVLDQKCGQILADKADEIKAAEKEAKRKKKGKIASKKSKKNKVEKYPFRMLGMDGKELHLSDFEGKVVYIDFWASWCGPCRKQFPYAKKLKAELHDRLDKKQLDDIVFLYISIDKTEAAWKSAVEKFGLKGVMAYSAPSWTDGAGAYFKVSGIPRYMIMDKTGTIINPNAKRPSMPGIMDELINLL